MVQPGAQGALKTEGTEVFQGFYEGFLENILHIGVLPQKIPAGANKGFFIGMVKGMKSHLIAL